MKLKEQMPPLLASVYTNSLYSQTADDKLTVRVQTDWRTITLFFF